jgi:hypothetical protein
VIPSKPQQDAEKRRDRTSFSTLAWGEPVEYLQGLVTVLVMPVLPEAYRKAWRWPLLLPEPLVAWTITLLHVGASALVWGFAFTSYQKAFGDMVAAAVADPNGSGEVGLITLYGIFGFFAFPLTWQGFLAWAYILDSVARFVALAVHGGFQASVFLAVPLWLHGRVLALAKSMATNAVYGKASEPDRLFEEGKTIRLRSTRPHPEWHANLAFHCRDTLFRLESESDVPEGKRRCFEYRFGPWPEQEIVRRVVLLTGEEEEPPPGNGGGTA